MHVLVGILASLAFSAGLAWYVAKPIGHLRQAFRAVSAGKLNTRVCAHAWGGDAMNSAIWPRISTA